MVLTPFPTCSPPPSKHRGSGRNATRGAPARHKEPGFRQKHRRAAPPTANPQFMGVMETRLPARGVGAGEAGQRGAVQMAAEKRF